MTNKEAIEIAIKVLQEKALALGMDNPEREKVMWAQVKLENMVTE